MDDIFNFLPQWARERHKDFQMEVAKHIWRQSQDCPPPAPKDRLRPEPGPYQNLARTAARECDRLLQILHPRAAIAEWRSVRASTLSALRNAGVMDRFRWVLGAKATGDSLDPAYLSEFFEQAGRWWAASLLAESYRDLIDGDVDLALSVDAMPGREFLTRTTSMTIRYHWASQMIATEIARQVRSDSDFAELLPDFTVANVGRITDAALGYNDGSAPITSRETNGMALAALMAIEAKALAGIPFEAAVTNRKMEMQPWVRYEDGLAPCAVTQVVFALERSVIAAIDDQLKGNCEKKLDKGELFERVAQQCISQSIGDGRRDIKRPYAIKLDPAQQERDIDFAIIGATVEVVGEVKAMEVPDPRRAAANTFETQIGEVYEQLTKRLTALDAGMPLIDGQQKQYRGAQNAIGIGAVLHPYSSSLGDPRMLAVVNHSAETARIAIADLHSWLLILTAMRGLKDLRSYLRFRDQLRQIEALSADECDMALAYFSPARDRELARYQRLYNNRDVDRPFTMVVPACAVSTQVALETAKPKDREKWRRKFFRDCTPLTPYPPGR